MKKLLAITDCVMTLTAALDEIDALRIKAQYAKHEGESLRKIGDKWNDENGALREALEWFEDQRLDALARAGYIQATEDRDVKELCEKHGYGAVMDSASRQWVKKDTKGAFFIGGCVGDTSARAALKGSDR